MRALTFEDHVALYAKGWYGRSDRDIISDLKDLLSEYSGTQIECILDREIIDIVIQTFVSTNNGPLSPHRVYDCLKEILIPSFPVDDKCYRCPVSVLIGKISSWKPDDEWPTLSDLKLGVGLLKTSFLHKNKGVKS